MAVAAAVLGLVLLVTEVATNGVGLITVIKATHHAAVSTTKTLTHPVRHPKKDAKAVGHWVKGDR